MDRVAVAMAASSVSPGSSQMKERSIFRCVSGSRLRQDRLE